jgi:hypothetical protein
MKGAWGMNLKKEEAGEQESWFSPLCGDLQSNFIRQTELI